MAQVPTIIPADDEFVRQVPPAADSPAATETAETAEPHDDDTQEVGDAQVADTAAEPEAAEAEADLEPVADDALVKPEADKPAATEAGTAEAGESEKKVEDKAEDKAANTTEAETENKGEDALVLPEAAELERVYRAVMSPLKANGKTIQLKSPEEAVKLIQMGANYTKQLQDLQPFKKMVLMLTNNDLADEGKLSFMIDVMNKEPEAIKKLIKDTGIDPLDIDVTSEAAYEPGSHIVSDGQVLFNDRLEDLKSTPGGIETLQFLNELDHTSKEALWANPEIMTIVHEHRSNGVYDAITTEMHRRHALGQLPANLPFFEAYTLVGDDLAKQAAEKSQGPGPAEDKPAPASATPPKVVATRAAAPKTSVANGDKASAAAVTKTGAKKVDDRARLASLPDDQFMAEFRGRV